MDAHETAPLRGPGALAKADEFESVRPTELPPFLLDRIPGRLQVLALVYLAVSAIGWIGVNVVEGQFLDEFRAAHEWVAPIVGIAASLALLAAVRGRISPRRLGLLGLVYQVVISYSIAVSGYWGAWRGVSVDMISADRVGFSAVAVWMILYATLVPTRPARQLLALVASASAIPVVYTLNERLGIAPSLPGQAFFIVFVLPYVLTCAGAYLITRIQFDLGQDVRRAREIGSYRLRERIAAGAMGEVWRADHTMLARPAAIKLIQPSMLAGEATAARAAVERFKREAQITATLESPNTVRLYDFGVTEDGTLYHVMELLHGIDLQTLVERFGRLPAERVVHILLQACASLAEAHRRGLLHRDVKPANLFLCQRAFDFDVVKVLDFGLARPWLSEATAAHPSVTQAHTVVGTPAVLAPELALGEETKDGRSDLYSLGCVAYWLLTGTVLFEASSPTAMIVAQVSTEPVAPSRRAGVELPAALEELILSCLAKKPGDRPQSADEIARRLEAIPLRERWSRERAESWWRAAGLETNDDQPRRSQSRTSAVPQERSPRER